MRTFPKRLGMAYLVVIIFAAILLILMTLLMRVRSGTIALLSKAAKDYAATSITEAGVNCLLSELRYDNDYHTHSEFKIGEKEPWKGPIKKRPSAIKGFGELSVSGVENGVYKGSLPLGDFKAKLGKVLFGKEDAKTQTLKEGGMYFRVEAVAHVGESKKAEEDSYRKTTLFLEKRSPISECLLFDGEMLDAGFGPYEKVANNLRRGRLYGYQYITLTTVSGLDKGSFFTEVEKIETPGQIRALKEAELKFSDTKTGKLNSGTDSSTYEGFKTYNGYVVDGSHGAHSFRLTHLPKEFIFEKAKRKNSGGFFIEKNTFPVSKWKNPYNLDNEFVDLNFGGYFSGEVATPTTPPGGGGENEDEDDGDPPYGTDDPEGIKTTRGKKLLIYSKVPLRIWGCPDRTITIFCERDVVIGGDFNQNPETTQDYSDAEFQNYKTPIENGKNNNKVGALVMSMGRVIIDMSRPCFFAKNEIKPFFLYQLALALHPNDVAYPNILKETKASLCPVNPKSRQGILGSEQSNASGTATPRFGAISWILSHPGATGGDAYERNLADVTNLLTPLADGKPHLGIKSEVVRQVIIEDLVQTIRKCGGALKREDLDRLFETVWSQVEIEEDANPDPTAGAMGMLNSLFDEAGKAFDDGIHIPEISINGALVSSTRRASSWKIGSVNQVGMAPLKAFDEIGNSPVAQNGIVEYLKKPKFIIQRVYGSEIRLATAEPAYFIDGRFTGTTILRRRLWDRSLVGSGLGGPFQPKVLPFSFNILTYRDETISKKEFEQF